MPKNDTTKRRIKPSKPTPDFPLFPHATKRWAKKIRGKLHYFGPWEDPDAALRRYLDEKDYLQAGRRPPVVGDGVTVQFLCNMFLTAKHRKVQAGEMQQRSWVDYRNSCELVVQFFGKDRPVDDLRPLDFSELRAELARRRGPIALMNHIRRIRSVFLFAYDADLIEKPIKYGGQFNPPGRDVQRKAKANGPVKMFDAKEIRRLLDVASKPMKAMILLAVNAGMGNTDCAQLDRSHIDLKKQILDFPRPKTGIERRAPLWPETVEAIRDAISVRPEPKNKTDEGAVFITKYGQRWVKFYDGNTGKGRGGSDYAISKEFVKLLKDLGIRQKGVGFYALRHTFETIAGETGDQAAVDRIMGHTRDDMASRYREWRKDKREDIRLRKVTDHVRKWLFAKKAKA